MYVLEFDFVWFIEWDYDGVVLIESEVFVSFVSVDFEWVLRE